MNRREFLVSAAAASCAIGIEAAGRSRPNVLLLHSHDLGRFLNCYGVSTVRTPNLNRLAAEGILFERSFATAPQCSPSRASIFTGRYPHCTGVLGLTGPPFMWDLLPEELHLGQLMKGAGYRTACAGVFHETHSSPQRCGLEEFSGKERATDVADTTIEMLTRFAATPDRPFYIQAGTLEPHRLPNSDPALDYGFLGGDLSPDDSAGVTMPGYLRDTPGTRRELAELQGSVSHVDREFGRVLDALRQLKLEQNTLVIFTTDHGVALPRAKCSLYEAGHETALIVRLPSRAGWYGGARQHVMLSNIDLLPSILEVTGTPTPSAVQGRSFAPLLEGRPYTERKEVFYELTFHDYYDPRRAVRDDRYKLIVNFSSAPAFMDPSQSWRPRSDTITPPNHALAYHPSAELYDLAQDPWEQRDLFATATHDSVKDRLRMLLRSHMEETNDPLLQGAVTCPMHRRSADWIASGSDGA